MGQHLLDITLRAAQRIDFLRKAYKVLDYKGRTAVYKGFVRPMLRYCPLVWSGATGSHLRRLAKVIERSRSHCRQPCAPSHCQWPVPAFQTDEWPLGTNAPTTAPSPASWQNIEHRRKRSKRSATHSFKLSLPLPVRSIDPIIRSFPMGR